MLRYFRRRRSLKLESPEEKIALNGTNGNGLQSSPLHAEEALKIPSPTHKPAKPSRDKWGSKTEFLLAVIGFAVDLSNVWRFPYICYRNGGGAFLIPYFVMFLFGGLPLFYMELALGQYHKSGSISIWKHVCPIFKGIGIAICIINSYVAFFYNTVISWAVYFMFASMRAEVPWKTCNNEWNTENCSMELSGLVQINRTKMKMEENLTRVSPAEEYYLRKVLEIQESTGIDDLGSIKWSLALCLFAVYILVYFSLWKGPKSSGKAVWITATMPYVVLTILLIRGLTLPGAFKGIEYYLTPVWGRLLDTRVWIDAATQIFFSLGPGFGVLMAFSSYNEFNNNCYKDAIITSIINCLTSLLSGFVIFAVLGYMSHMLDRDIDKVAGDGGPGLIFIVYPQAIATMAGSSFWAVIFFFMLITLGLDSTFGGLESIICGFCDEFPHTIGRHREIFVLVLVIYCFLGGLPTTTYGGQYLVEFYDHYGVSLTILFVVFIEAVAICWFYGVRRFSQDVMQMLGFCPGILWRICWTAISPIFVLVIFIFAVVDLRPLTFPGYEYPEWSVVLGWVLRCSSLLCIPVYMVYHVCKLEGSLSQRLKTAITPIEAPPDSRRNSLLPETENYLIGAQQTLGQL